MIWTKITKYIMSDGRCALHWPSGDIAIRRYITNEQTVYGWITERSSRNLRFSTNRQRYIFNCIEKHFFKVCVNRSTFLYRSYIECTNDIRVWITFYCFTVLIALQMHYNFSYCIFYAFTYITNNYLHIVRIKFVKQFLLK